MQTIEFLDDSFEAFASLTQTVAPGTDESEWPIDIRAALLAWEVLGPPLAERRQIRRRPYRQALRLEIDAGEVSEAVLFSRDVHSLAVGFLSLLPLPINAAATVHLPMGDRLEAVRCTVRRSQPFIRRWNEGALLFTERQPHFE